MSKVWKFKTRNFVVALEITPISGYRYDGDDPSGEIQAAIDSGEMVAFDSAVTVKYDGETIGADYLGGSVYMDGREHEFWTAHRGPDPMDRNCTIMRAKRGENMCIGHYFPDMVQAAIAEARDYIRDQPVYPYIRKGA